jgi:hypothetical protein
MGAEGSKHLSIRKASKPALMTVFVNSDAWDTSNVWFDSQKIRLYSKREKRPEMLYRLGPAPIAVT